SNPLCYDIMTPESVGAEATRIVLGKHSGRHALAKRYEELGAPLAPGSSTTPTRASSRSPTGRRESTIRICWPSRRGVWLPDEITDHGSSRRRYRPGGHAPGRPRARGGGVTLRPRIHIRRTRHRRGGRIEARPGASAGDAR